MITCCRYNIEIRHLHFLWCYIVMLHVCNFFNLFAVCWVVCCSLQLGNSCSRFGLLDLKVLSLMVWDTVTNQEVFVKMNLLWQQKLCNLQQLENRSFHVLQPKFLFLLKTPLWLSRNMLHDGKTIQCLPNPSQHVPSIVSELYDA